LVQKKILKAADKEIKKTLVTPPPAIEAKVDFIKEIQELKGQHKQHKKL
jgi:hypothetical protein